MLLPKVEVRVATPLAVALALRTKVVPLVTDATTVPAAMPVPVTSMPGINPTVLPTVTIGVPLTVTALERARVPVKFATTGAAASPLVTDTLV